MMEWMKYSPGSPDLSKKLTSSLSLMKSLQKELRKATPRRKKTLLNQMRLLVNSANGAVSKAYGVPWRPLKVAR
jgi:hypothetical protein